MYPSQQNATDHTANFFWLLVLICLILLGLWYFKPDFIILPIFWLRKVEVLSLLYISDVWNPIAALLHLPLLSVDNLKQLYHAVMYVTPDKLPFAYFASVNFEVGRWLQWPVMVVLTVLAAVTYVRHTDMLFSTYYDMQSLKMAESENWPQIQPVISLDLLAQDLDTGPWAMAQTPLGYCKAHNLAYTKQNKERKTIWAVQKRKSAQLLSLQLGPLITSFQDTPIYIKGLMVVCIARILKKDKMAKHFLSQFALSARSGKIDFSGVSEQFTLFQTEEVVQWLAQRHSYLRTFMLSLLELSRMNGVLASAEFLWLKPVDRVLWYALNSVGRQTVVVEVSGIFAHWKAEKLLGRGLKVPMVTQAISALDGAMSNILYVSKEEQWRSKED